MNVRIARRSNDQRGAADLPQTVLHPIAIHHPVAFRRHLAGPQRVDHEALQQIDIISGVERLPARPELGEMGAVGTRLYIVDDARAVVFGAAGRIDERTGREHQRADAAGAERPFRPRSPHRCDGRRSRRAVLPAHRAARTRPLPTVQSRGHRQAARNPRSRACPSRSRGNRGRAAAAHRGIRPTSAASDAAGELETGSCHGDVDAAERRRNKAALDTGTGSGGVHLITPCRRGTMPAPGCADNCGIDRAGPTSIHADTRSGRDVLTKGNAIRKMSSLTALIGGLVAASNRTGRHHDRIRDVAQRTRRLDRHPVRPRHRGRHGIQERGQRREDQADPARRRLRSLCRDPQRAQAHRGRKGRSPDRHGNGAFDHRDAGGRDRTEGADDLDLPVPSADPVDRWAISVPQPPSCWSRSSPTA